MASWTGRAAGLKRGRKLQAVQTHRVTMYWSTVFTLTTQLEPDSTELDSVPVRYFTVKSDGNASWTESRTKLVTSFNFGLAACVIRVVNLLLKLGIKALTTFHTPPNAPRTGNSVWLFSKNAAIINNIFSTIHLNAHFRWFSH